jgi:hypothetical protein
LDGATLILGNSAVRSTPFPRSESPVLRPVVDRDHRGFLLLPKLGV